MGRPRTTDHHKTPKSHTLPSSPTHSSSSSDFEFTISLSPRTKSSATAPALCPADELFYKGQLLPLHLSPRLSMVRTLLSSSSTSSSSTTTTAGRHSSSSTASSCDSSRPSSATSDLLDDEFKRLNLTANRDGAAHHHHQQIKKPSGSKYFSLSRFSSVFRTKIRDPDNQSGSTNVKRVSVTAAKEVFRKYLKKVKPLYEKLSSSSAQKHEPKTSTNSFLSLKPTEGPVNEAMREREISSLPKTQSFSGNLRYPRNKKSCVSSCPSSMRSSPSHSGILYRPGFPGPCISPVSHSGFDAASMEELQSAIQGAIAHCKNSMVENKPMVSSSSNEI